VRNILGEPFPLLRLGALTAAALAIHGYHLGTGDGEIYVPAAKKLLQPDLYPYASEFFLSHAHMSLFSSILAWTARLTHMSMDWTLIVWYTVSIFALLASCWLLLTACFVSARARWTGILTITAVLTMPVANTALPLMDPYMTARSFSTPLTIFALACFLKHRYLPMGVATVLTATIHPQMSIYLLFLVGVIWLAEWRENSVPEKVPVLAAFAGILPTGFQLSPATGAYHDALYSRDYFFLSNWAWYDWMGLLAPLAILAWFWKGRLRGTLPSFQRISFALLPFGLLSIAAGGLVSSSPRFDMFVRLQPLRSFHIITLVFILLLAGVAGEYLAKDRPWVVAAICLPLAAGMFFVSRQTYPNSPQIELPCTTSRNPWLNALLWVRQNTPVNAVFAVDAGYLKDDLSDTHGFRAISERSSLSDYFKDGGAASLFPALADKWQQRSNATHGLNGFSTAQFRGLKEEFPAASWTVIHGPAPTGMSCPYQQQNYSVCHLPMI